MKSKKAVDLYDAVAQKFIAKGVIGQRNITVAKNGAVVIVETAAGSKLTKNKGNLLANGIVIDYNVAK